MVAYIRQREELVLAEEPDADGDSLRVLWGLLRVLCLNQGTLRSPAKPAKAKARQPLGGIFTKKMCYTADND